MSLFCHNELIIFWVAVMKSRNQGNVVFGLYDLVKLKVEYQLERHLCYLQAAAQVLQERLSTTSRPLSDDLSPSHTPLDERLGLLETSTQG